MKVLARFTEIEVDSSTGIMCGLKEPVEIRIPPASVVALELERKMTILEAMETNDPGWFPWLVWHACTIRRGEKREFDAWLTAMEDVDDVTPQLAAAVGTDGEAGPTGAGPNPGSADSPESSPESGSAETSS